MKRRHFLAAAALAGGAAACSPSSPNAATNNAPMVNRNRTRKFNLVTTWPKDFPGLGAMPERFSEFVRQMSGGSLEINVYASGELVQALESFDTVATGGADMYHGAEYYWTSKSPAFSFFTAVPLGLTAQEFTGWIEFGGGRALWEELSGNFGIHPLYCGNTGHQMGGWFKKEMNTLEDFKGLKMRIPGIGGDVLRELGGAPTLLPGSEIYQALQSGNIDATEWVGPWNDYALGFYREAKYYYGPGFHEPGAALAVGVNLSVWNSLSQQHQSILRRAAQAVNDMSLGEYMYENAKALEKLSAEGVELRSFTSEMWTEITRASEDVVSKVGNTDALSKRIYKSYLEARNLQRHWSELAEGGYVQTRKTGLDAL